MITLNLPQIPLSPMFIGDESKTMTLEWQEFFRGLFDRVGGTASPTITESNTSIVAELYKTDKSYSKRIDDSDLSGVVELYKTDKSYAKRIDDSDLSGVVELYKTDKNYAKRIDELEKTIIGEPSPVPSIGKPSFSTNNAVVRWDGTLGTKIQDSVVTLDDTGNMVFPDATYIAIDEIRAIDGDGLKLYDDGGSGIFVADGGNVGINDATALYPLSVIKSVVLGDFEIIADFRQDNAADGFLMGTTVANFVGGSKAAVITSRGTDDHLIYRSIRNGNIYFEPGGTGYTTPTPNHVLHSSGNVGFGTTIPDKNLEINSASGGELRLTYNDANGTATDYVDLKVGSDGDLTITTVDSDGAGGDIILMPDGNVGIGEILPVAKLHITGTSGSLLRLSDSDATTDRKVGVFLEFYRGRSTNRVGYFGFTSTSSDELTYATDYTDAFLTFKTGDASERIRIDKDGNVGIGTTAPDKTLEINAASGGSLRLTYNDANGSATDHTDLSVNADGALLVESTDDVTIRPDGETQIGGAANYTAIETDGTVEFNGDATVWNDANVGGMALGGPAANLPAEVKFTDEAGGDTGIYTYGFSPATDQVAGAIEIPHSYKEGSDISFHVHWNGPDAPTGTDKVQWQLTYTVAQGGQTLDATTTIVIETDIDTQYKMYTSGFPTITGTNFNMGDQFLFRLTRIAASVTEYGGTANVMTVGFHYEQDTIGSRQIITK